MRQALSLWRWRLMHPIQSRQGRRYERIMMQAPSRAAYERARFLLNNCTCTTALAAGPENGYRNGNPTCPVHGGLPDEGIT